MRMFQTVTLVKVDGILGMSVVGGINKVCHPFGVNEPGVFISKVCHEHMLSIFYTTASTHFRHVLCIL